MSSYLSSLYNLAASELAGELGFGSDRRDCNAGPNLRLQQHDKHDACRRVVCLKEQLWTRQDALSHTSAHLNGCEQGQYIIHRTPGVLQDVQAYVSISVHCRGSRFHATSIPGTSLHED